MVTGTEVDAEAGEPEADGVAEADAPAGEAVSWEAFPQAAGRASVTASAATVTTDRRRRERFMTATMLRTRNIRHRSRFHDADADPDGHLPPVQVEAVKIKGEDRKSRSVGPPAPADDVLQQMEEGSPVG